MGIEKEIYYHISAMEPLYPEDTSGNLENLAIDLIAKANRLYSSLNPITQSAIANFLRPLNSYYSNLIEGHDTHPIDIERALNNDFSNDKIRRNLQIEACAHIYLYKQIAHELKENKDKSTPTTKEYLKSIHKRFYDVLPEEMKTTKTTDGKIIPVVPGEWREVEVEVGKHIGPYSKHLNNFIERFESFYNPTSKENQSKIRRIISIAASHHRLVWIHPFVDGNGRVARLYSDACFIYEELDAGGLWSISRGLARNNRDYKSNLANADLKRYNDYDGRGNLSNKMLVNFCEFFLETAIDQINFMSKLFETDSVIKRIETFVDLLSLKGKMRLEAKPILSSLFLKGRISKPEAMRLTGFSDKTLKNLVHDLESMELLESRKEGILMMYYVKYPLKYSTVIFPNLYPENKELDILRSII